MQSRLLSAVLLLTCCQWSIGGDVAPQTQLAVQSLPASRGGQDLLGTKMPPLKFDRWIGKEPPQLDGSVVLYRWWTDACPFCARTLPAIEQLRKEFGPRGLKVVAVYHPKPPRDVEDEKIAQAAARIGYGGAIAIDSNWNALRQVWLSTGHRRATSVSFLIDRQGVIRFIHPGVQFFPSSDSSEAQANSDYWLLRSAIEQLLPPLSPATAPAAKALSESEAEEFVAEIPEVGQFMDSVSRNSHGQSHGLLFSEGHSVDSPMEWIIYVGEDRDDDGASCWHKFRVNRETGTVSVDSGMPHSTWMPLKSWQAKHANNPSP